MDSLTSTSVSLRTTQAQIPESALDRLSPSCNQWEIGAEKIDLKANPEGLQYPPPRRLASFLLVCETALAKLAMFTRFKNGYSGWIGEELVVTREQTADFADLQDCDQRHRRLPGYSGHAQNSAESDTRQTPRHLRRFSRNCFRR